MEFPIAGFSSVKYYFYLKKFFSSQQPKSPSDTEDSHLIMASRSIELFDYFIFNCFYYFCFIIKASLPMNKYVIITVATSTKNTQCYLHYASCSVVTKIQQPLSTAYSPGFAYREVCEPPSSKDGFALSIFISVADQVKKNRCCLNRKENSDF